MYCVKKGIARMQIENLHKNSYSQLTQYYADLSEPMAALRQQILSMILTGAQPNVMLHNMGAILVDEKCIPALDIEKSILDVGCANGDNLAIMRDMGFHHLSGIDIAPTMVAEAVDRTRLPIQCIDLFEYQTPKVDVVFAQALVHLFPKRDLSRVLHHLLSLARQRFYFSTTIHDQGSEGLEPKEQIVRYRSRYTTQELLAHVHLMMENLNNRDTTWRVFYFFLTDCLGKHWINFVFDKIDLPVQYEKAGAIICRNFIDQNAVKTLNEELIHFRTTEAPKNTWLRYDDGEVFDRVENFLPFLNQANQTIFNAIKYFELIEKCFGNKVVLLKDKCNFKPPGKQPFPLHQDAAAGWEKSGYGPKHINIAISLDTVSAENAAVEFVLGQHRQGLFSELYEVIDSKYFDQWQFHSVEMMPGDAIIFDSYTPHFSKANLSNQPRKILFLTYIDEKFADAASQFFIDKRLRQPPIDERDSSMKLVRNDYGKWVRQ